MDIEKRKNFIINTLFLLIWAILAWVIIQYGIPLLFPFIMAFLIAWSLRKPIRWLENKLHLPQRVASLVMVILFYCTIGLVITLLVFRCIVSFQAMIQQLPTVYAQVIEPGMRQALNNIEMWNHQWNLIVDPSWNELIAQLMTSLGQLVSSLSVVLMQSASSFAISIPGVFIGLVLMIISTFFLAMDYDRIVQFGLRQLNLRSQKILMQIKNYIVGTLFLCVRSYAMIMTITFIELAIGLSVLQVENALLIALMIAVFDILPVLGTGGIMIPWIIITLLQGNLPLALGLGAVYLIITVIRNIIEPKIVGSQLGLHPVLTLISMFVGVRYFGFLGMFGFPILLSLLKYLNDNGTIQLYK